MRVSFTTHAIKRMRERGISRTEVIGAINSPDEIARDRTSFNRFVAKKIFPLVWRLKSIS
ncbi:DUF4258 domain-containing protein [Patescibacteria group bacterium]|nr:MAG: DUF4258 domain-containing protein [Patescibacteria group bacterium]